MTLCLPCCRSCLCKSPISLLTRMHVTAITQNRGDAIWLADFSLTYVRHMRALLNAYMQTTSWHPDQSLAILFFFFRPLSRRAVNLMSVPPHLTQILTLVSNPSELPHCPLSTKTAIFIGSTLIVTIDWFEMLFTSSNSFSGHSHTSHKRLGKHVVNFSSIICISMLLS